MNTIRASSLAFFVLALISLFTAAHAPAVDRYALRKVVIDAGHGGHDTGCLGSNAREKHVTLAIALKLGKLIEDNYPDIKVLYTRKTDVFVELYQRATIANNSKADLFISIHCNSGPKTAYGTETFAMGLHKTEDNLNVAKRENASVLLEKDYQVKYDGFDPNSPESHIIFALYQNAFLNQSLNFAAKVEQQFKANNRLSRGVKQAGFLVLYKTTMPSVLIETGFLTNLNEEKLLNSEKGQYEISNHILAAFKEFKTEMESGVAAKGVIDAPKENNNPNNSEPSNKVADGTIYLSVQFATSSKPIPLNSSRLKGVKDSREEKHPGIYKYLSGKFYSMQDALAAQKIIKDKGFADAFIVGFQNGKRITASQAETLLK